IRAVTGVAHVSSVTRIRGWVDYGGQKNYGEVYGTDIEYPTMYGWSFDKGRFFKKSDVEDAGNVAVIGSGVSDALFGNANAVGEMIGIHGQQFKVKGVFSTNDPDQSQMVVIPY